MSEANKEVGQAGTMPNQHIGLLYDPAVLDHQPPFIHPEQPARVNEVMALLEQSGILERLTRLPVTPATRAQIERVHTPTYLDRVERIVRQGGGYLDMGNTFASPGSWAAVTAASGAAIGAVDAVITGGMDASFALVRPPGHHAPRGRAMGFCILNHAAMAASHAIARHGLTRILLVDFDVHHGNGTQECFYDSPQVLYFSTHQSPAYPFTGAVEEIGSGSGEGYTVNVPLPPDVGAAGFLQAFDMVLRPLAHRFRPEMVIVSAGYDAHWRNGLYVKGIRERLTVRGLCALSQSIQEIAEVHCPGKLVGILEGGYDLESLAYGVLGTLRVWLGDMEIEDPIGPAPSDAREPDITQLLARVRQAHGLQQKSKISECDAFDFYTQAQTAGTEVIRKDRNEAAQAGGDGELIINHAMA
ncbi:MAG: histone deacetylase [Armatimonadota bacterium]|nr:histone deacetylase [Armatimonadota bacterium]